jgi:hypothetical protein
MGARNRAVFCTVVGLAVGGLAVVSAPASADQSVLSLVSAGTPGSGRNDGASFDGATPDGSHVYFHTLDSLVPQDTDGGASDVYERVGGTTRLVSTGSTDPQAVVDASFGGVSDDGSRVFFTTAA